MNRAGLIDGEKWRKRVGEGGKQNKGLAAKRPLRKSRQKQQQQNLVRHLSSLYNQH